LLCCGVVGRQQYVVAHLEVQTLVERPHLGGVGGRERLLDEQEFDNLLFAHGDPLVGGGRSALQAFAAGVPTR